MYPYTFRFIFALYCIHVSCPNVALEARVGRPSVYDVYIHHVYLSKLEC